MPLSRDFKDTVMELCQQPAFRQQLILEAIAVYHNAEITVGNSLLLDYINATGSADEIAGQLGVAVPSLRRMLSPKGNPTARNLMRIIQCCREREGMSTEAIFRAA